MDNNEIYFKKENILEESDQVDKSKVQFQREWAFWENYDTKSGGKLDWKESIKKIIKFNDIISFWQFWNSYPGSDASNIFFNGDRLR